MINNLKALAANERDWPHMLDLVDYQAALADDDNELLASLAYERGDLWERLGVVDLARQSYADCAQLTRSQDLGQRANEKIDQLQSGGETLH